MAASYDEVLAALKELSGAVEEYGSLEVDRHGNPVSQSAAGRNYDRRCVARSKAKAVIAKAESKPPRRLNRAQCLSQIYGTGSPVTVESLQNAVNETERKLHA